MARLTRLFVEGQPQHLIQRGNNREPIFVAEEIPTSERLHQKILGLDGGLLEDRAQSAFRHLTGVVGNGGVAAGLRVEPDFVRACGLAVEFEAELL